MFAIAGCHEHRCREHLVATIGAEGESELSPPTIGSDIALVVDNPYRRNTDSALGVWKSVTSSQWLSPISNVRTRMVPVYNEVLSPRCEVCRPPSVPGSPDCWYLTLSGDVITKPDIATIDELCQISGDLASCFPPAGGVAGKETVDGTGLCLGFGSLAGVGYFRPMDPHTRLQACSYLQRPQINALSRITTSRGKENKIRPYLAIKPPPSPFSVRPMERTPHG